LKRNDDDLNRAQDEDDDDEEIEEDEEKQYEDLFPEDNKHIIRVDSNNHEIATTSPKGRTSCKIIERKVLSYKIHE